VDRREALPGAQQAGLHQEPHGLPGLRDEVQDTASYPARPAANSAVVRPRRLGHPGIFSKPTASGASRDCMLVAAAGVYLTRACTALDKTRLTGLTPLERWRMAGDLHAGFTRFPSHLHMGQA
jgi:hypothetical protein